MNYPRSRNFDIDQLPADDVQRQLKSWRQKCELTQGDASGMLGVQQQTISAWERGRYWMSPQRKDMVGRLFIRMGIIDEIPPAQHVDFRPREYRPRTSDRQRLPEVDASHLLEKLTDAFIKSVSQARLGPELAASLHLLTEYYTSPGREDCQAQSAEFTDLWPRLVDTYISASENGTLLDEADASFRLLFEFYSTPEVSQ